MKKSRVYSSTQTRYIGYLAKLPYPSTYYPSRRTGVRQVGIMRTRFGISGVRRSGFSLLEMVICVCLIGVLLSISSISYTRSSIDYRSTINQVKSDLRNIITLAQFTGPVYVLEAASDNKSYEIRNTCEPPYKKVNLKNNVYIVIPKSGNHKKGRVLIRNLKRSGGSDAPFSIYIINASSKKSEKLTVMLGTSRIDSYDYNYELSIKELNSGLANKLRNK